ncbi:hypothetical protein D3C87_687570 [compost metagenome]
MSATKPDGWVVTYTSGNRGYVMGKKPEPHEIIREVVPFYIGRPHILPPTASMLPHIEKAYVSAFMHGKQDKSYRAAEGTLRRVATIGADKYIQSLGLKDVPSVAIDYTAASEQLAYSIHGTTINQLGDADAENVRRYARSAVHAALGIVK